MAGIRVVITGGGTGGHLYPALAVAEALQSDPEAGELLYIGNKTRREAELVPQAGIAFEGITFSGMPRQMNPIKLVAWGADLLRSYHHARRILQAFRPHVVLGTGGYVTAPVLFAAMSLGIPYVNHEPDAHPGLVNRLMSRWAYATTCAFAGARERLQARDLHVTGNPLRSQIGQVSRDVARQQLEVAFDPEKPVLLVIGGSQGARRLNQAVLEALPELIDALGFQVFHQTGDTLYEETHSQCPESFRARPAYVMRPFIQDMASVLALADIAVSRSGSMSLSEIYRAHLPSILVPYPYAAADHQRKNALASQSAGASLMIEDAAFTGESLTSTLSTLWGDAARKQAMQQAAEALAAPDATAQVVLVLKRAAQPALS